MSERRLYFDPEAPGVRGLVGIMVGVFGLMGEWTAGYLQAIKGYYDDMHPRVRGLTMVLFSIALLMVVGVVFAYSVLGQFFAPDKPTLADAIIVPYSLDERPTPADNMAVETMLPASFGPFVLSTDKPAGHTFSLVSQCLMNRNFAGPDTVDADRSLDGMIYCERSFAAVTFTAGRYFDENNNSVDVVIAKFNSSGEAKRTMIDLVGYARKLGQIGNFAIAGIKPVDYIYALSLRQWASLTWSKGPFIFSVSSSRNIKTMEQAVDVFPY
jgi:hypothetical protein